MSKSNEFTKRLPLAQFFRLLGKENSQPIIISLISGVLSGLKDQRITIEQAENIVFNPDMLLLCDEQNYNASLIEVIEYGMEFIDIDEWVEDKTALLVAIETCQNNLSHIKTSTLPYDIPMPSLS